jgi:imidazoleglycerol phosphate dehydratase HisB
MVADPSSNEINLNFIGRMRFWWNKQQSVEKFKMEMHVMYPARFDILVTSTTKSTWLLHVSAVDMSTNHHVIEGYIVHPIWYAMSANRSSMRQAYLCVIYRCAQK